MNTLSEVIAVAGLGAFLAVGVMGSILLRYSPPNCVSEFCEGEAGEAPPASGQWYVWCHQGPGNQCDATCPCTMVILEDGVFTDFVSCSCGGQKANLPPCYAVWEDGQYPLGNHFATFKECVNLGCSADEVCVNIGISAPSCACVGG